MSIPFAFSYVSGVPCFHYQPTSDLGWYDSESYGISYKVRGFCKDLSNPEMFDEVNVRGDILRSHIHHLYFGHYSYGHQGGNFSFNVVRARLLSNRTWYLRIFSSFGVYSIIK